MNVLEAIKSRKSIRRYKSTPIPEDAIKKLEDAVRWAPSMNNQQPYKFIFIRDEDTKRLLVGACNNQKWIAEAPRVVVACGIPDEAFGILGGYMNSYPVDVAIAMEHFVLTATDLGLGTCWIANFKEEKVQHALNIPEDVRVVALATVGYANEEPDPDPRKHKSELFYYEKYED